MVCARGPRGPSAIHPPIGSPYVAPIRFGFAEMTEQLWFSPREGTRYCFGVRLSITVEAEVRGLPARRGLLEAPQPLRGDPHEWLTPDARTSLRVLSRALRRDPHTGERAPRPRKTCGLVLRRGRDQSRCREAPVPAQGRHAGRAA